MEAFQKRLINLLKEARNSITNKEEKEAITNKEKKEAIANKEEKEDITNKEEKAASPNKELYERLKIEKRDLREEDIESPWHRAADAEQRSDKVILMYSFSYK